MKLIQLLAASATLSLSLPVFATQTPITTTYDFTTAPVAAANNTPGNTVYNPYTTSFGNLAATQKDFGNTLSFGSSSGANVYNSTVNVSAYASTGSVTGAYGTGVNAQIQTGIVTYYAGNGLAITSQNVTTNAIGSNFEYYNCTGTGNAGNTCKDNSANDPADNNSFKSTDEQHAIDNAGAYEALLLSFNSKVKLNALSIGYPTGATPDSDATVLYYTGNGVPQSVLNYSFASLISSGLWAVANGTSIAGSANGTNSVDSLYNLGSKGGTGAVVSPIASRYFLIGAYIPLTGETNNPDAANTPDYLKLKAISTTQVPEPGSLALFGIAGGALFAGHRRRQAKAA